MTPQIDVRSSTAEEWTHFVEVADSAFASDMAPEARDNWARMVEPSRRLVATETGQIVGTAANLAFQMTVPGGEIPVAGLSMVTVRPTHRRRGILRQLMRRNLNDTHARGEVASILWASEAAIYQRFGYGIGTFRARIAVDRGDGAPLRRAEPVGRVRMLDHAEALAVLPEIYDRLRPSIPGTLRRSQFWWDTRRLADFEWVRHGGSQLFRVVLEIDGRPEGYALYRIYEGRDADGHRTTSLDALEVLATTPAATREIWDFLFGVDLVVRVQSTHLHPDHPLLLSTLDARALNFRLMDGLWLRLVDVEAALVARTYGIAGTLTFELSDPLCSWNDGVWQLEGSPDGAQIRRSTASPDLRLTAAELSAMYLGGVACTSLWRAGRIDEATPGAAHRADLLFRADVPPWCLDDF